MNFFTKAILAFGGLATLISCEPPGAGLVEFQTPSIEYIDNKEQIATIDFEFVPGDSGKSFQQTKMIFLLDDGSHSETTCESTIQFEPEDNLGQIIISNCQGNGDVYFTYQDDADVTDSDVIHIGTQPRRSFILFSSSNFTGESIEFFKEVKITEPIYDTTDTGQVISDSLFGSIPLNSPDDSDVPTARAQSIRVDEGYCVVLSTRYHFAGSWDVFGEGKHRLKNTNFNVGSALSYKKLGSGECKPKLDIPMLYDKDNNPYPLNIINGQYYLTSLEGYTQEVNSRKTREEASDLRPGTSPFTGERLNYYFHIPTFDAGTTFTRENEVMSGLLYSGAPMSEVWFFNVQGKHIEYVYYPEGPELKEKYAGKVAPLSYISYREGGFTHRAVKLSVPKCYKVELITRPVYMEVFPEDREHDEEIKQRYETSSSIYNLNETDMNEVVSKYNLRRDNSCYTQSISIDGVNERR